MYVLEIFIVPVLKNIWRIFEKYMTNMSGNCEKFKGNTVRKNKKVSSNNS